MSHRRLNRIQTAVSPGRAAGTLGLRPERHDHKGILVKGSEPTVQRTASVGNALADGQS